METGCQGGQGSPRAVAPGRWMDSASGWLFKKKSITMHGNMNVKMDDRCLNHDWEHTSVFIF